MQQEIAQRLRRLVNDSPPRRILGLAGCPGAGKSTLARVIVAEMPGTAIAVPMDGFHLANSVLQQFGRTARKGAPDTFDVDGYVALLARLRTDSTSTIYAPEFRRNVEEPVAAAIVVSPAVRLVVTEGNYLLHEHGGWERVRSHLDECWFVDVDDDVRIRRLIDRHVAYGKTEPAARAWALGSDQRNAELILLGKTRADWIVTEDRATTTD